MDSFFGIGIGELFFIAIIALIVLGPERLPGAIREVAKWSRTIRNLSSELTSQFSEEMKAFDDINPQKILRELTEEPTEQINKATGAAATKPAAKPATTTAKPPVAKTTPAKPAAGGATAGTAAGTTAAKSMGGITPSKNMTPPLPKKASTAAAANAAPSSESKPEPETTAQGEAEPSILPPAGDSSEGLSASQAGTEDANQPEAPVAASAAAQNSAPVDPVSADESEESTAVTRHGDAAQPEGDDKIVVDTAASRPALTVNGKSPAVEGEA